jgi:hypothetical protein
MQVEKSITINIDQYQSVKIGVSGAPSYEDADTIIIAELDRLKLPVNDKIKQALHWQTGIKEWM